MIKVYNEFTLRNATRKRARWVYSVSRLSLAVLLFATFARPVIACNPLEKVGRDTRESSEDANGIITHKMNRTSRGANDITKLVGKGEGSAYVMIGYNRWQSEKVYRSPSPELKGSFRLLDDALYAKPRTQHLVVFNFSEADLATKRKYLAQLRDKHLLIDQVDGRVRISVSLHQRQSLKEILRMLDGHISDLHVMGPLGSVSQEIPTETLRDLTSEWTRVVREGRPFANVKELDQVLSSYQDRYREADRLCNSLEFNFRRSDTSADRNQIQRKLATARSQRAKYYDKIEALELEKRRMSES